MEVSQGNGPEPGIGSAPEHSSLTGAAARKSNVAIRPKHKIANPRAALLLIIGSIRQGISLYVARFNRIWRAKTNDFCRGFSGVVPVFTQEFRGQLPRVRPSNDGRFRPYGMSLPYDRFPSNAGSFRKQGEWLT